MLRLKAELLNGDADLPVVPITGAQRATELEQKRLLELGTMAMNFQVASFNRDEFIKIMAESMIPRISQRIVMDPQQAMMQAQQQAMYQQVAGAANAGAGGSGSPPPSNQVTSQNAAQEVGRDQGEAMSQ